LKGLGEGRRGGRYLALAVGIYTAVCCPDESKHSIEEVKHSTDKTIGQLAMLGEG
jgi:hypothetical protein